MFIRVFCNFHLIYEGYFLISSFISSDLFSNMSSYTSLLIHLFKLDQPNNLYLPKLIFLNNKFSQISSTKHVVNALIRYCCFKFDSLPSPPNLNHHVHTCLTKSAVGERWNWSGAKMYRFVDVQEWR